VRISPSHRQSLVGKKFSKGDVCLLQGHHNRFARHHGISRTCFVGIRMSMRVEVFQETLARTGNTCFLVA